MWFFIILTDFQWLCIWFSIILGVSSRFLDESIAAKPVSHTDLISCVDEIARNFFRNRENVLIISAGGSIVAGEIFRLMAPSFAINLTTKDSRTDFSAIIDYIVLEGDDVTDTYEVVESMILNPRGRYVIVTRNEPEDIEIIAGKFWSAGIPNVIFLKPLNDRNATVFGYKISSRPYHTNATRELQVLDLWEGKFAERNNLFPNKFTNMNKYPLKVSVLINELWRLELRLTWEHGEPKLIGVGSKVLNEFAKKMNFTIVIFSRQASDNGTAAEVLGQVLQRNADLTFAIIDSTFPVAKALDHSVPYRIEQCFFVMGFPNRTVSWKSILKTFSTKLWTFMLLTILASFCLAVSVQRLWDTNTVGEFIRVIDIVKVLVGQSVVHPKQSGFRLAFALWMLYAFLMTACFTGSLLKILSTPSFQRVPKTIEELSNSQLTIRGFDEVKVLLSESSDPVQRRLGDRFATIVGLPEESWEFFSNREAVPLSDAYVALHNWYNRNNEFRQLRIIEGDFMLFFYSYNMWKGHPYREPLDHFIGYVQSSGLINKWLSDEHALPVNKRSKNEGEAVVLTLYHFASVFLVLVCGCGVGIITFFCELYHSRGQ